MPRCYRFDSLTTRTLVIKFRDRCCVGGHEPARLSLDESPKIPETTAEALSLIIGMPGELRDQLAAYVGHSRRLQPAIAAAYDRLIGHLMAVYSGQIGPAVGDPMPDFLLSDQNGHLMALDRFLEDGPLVISMNRGHWCPFCKIDLRALAKIAPEIRRRGAQVVSIMPEKARFTKQSIADNALPFPILSDVDLAYALSLGMVYWVGTEVKQLYEDLDLDLERFQGNSGYFLPMAAKFIVGRDGIIKARQIDVDYRQRMEPSVILEALARL